MTATTSTRCPADRPCASLSLGERTNALARCGCEACCAQLERSLAGYTAVVLRGRQPDGVEPEDLRQEAAVALMVALRKWPQTGPFAAWYGGVLRYHVVGLARHAGAARRCPAERPLSLDARREDGRALADAVPSSLDLAEHDLGRQRVFDEVAARRPQLTAREKRKRRARAAQRVRDRERYRARRRAVHARVARDRAAARREAKAAFRRWAHVAARAGS